MRRYIILLFLLLGGMFGTAHAAQSGEAHNHDGIVCDAGLVEEVGDIALPPPATDAPLPTPAPASWTDAAPTRSVTPKPARAPPQRGPPQLS